MNGKLQFGGRPGPASVLTPEEERKLVDYAVHMAQIGYGCTREQILNIVAQIVAEDGRQNPFINGRPGRKWWSLFKKRNPTVTLRTPEKLQEPSEEGCDVGTDELYAIWLQMKQLSLKETPSLPAAPEPLHSNPERRNDSEVKKSVQDDILVYPSVPESKKSKNTAFNSLPKHMSGEQFVEYLQEKQDEKERMEEKKKERELKKIQLAEERKKKKLERDKKKEEAERKKKEQRSLRRGRGGRKGLVHEPTPEPETNSDDSSKNDDDSDDEVCGQCNTDDDGRWVKCDNCETWFHYRCVGLEETDCIGDIDWFCSNC